MPRLSPSTLAVFAVLLALPAAATAQNSREREGLWRVRSNVAGTVSTTEICAGPPTVIVAPGALPQPPDPSCQKVEAVPGGYRVEGDCVLAGRRIRGSRTVVGDLQTHYAQDTDVRSNDEPAINAHLEADWIGECSAGMKPGDARLTSMTPAPVAPEVQ